MCARVTGPAAEKPPTDDVAGLVCHLLSTGYMYSLLSPLVLSYWLSAPRRTATLGIARHIQTLRLAVASNTRSSQVYPVCAIVITV